jgi:hypothetical protein
MSTGAGILDDYQDLEPFAKGLGRHPRTIMRWTDQPDGLPYLKLGNRVLFHVPTAKAWIFGRMRTANPRKPEPRRHRRSEEHTAA